MNHIRILVTVLLAVNFSIFAQSSAFESTSVIRSSSDNNETSRSLEETEEYDGYKNVSVSSEVMAAYKKLAKQKAASLRADLSLSESQEERLAIKIVKYSIMAEDVLQSSISTNQKNDALYTIAAEQQEEMREIMTTNQYQFYRRRNGAITSTTR